MWYAHKLSFNFIEKSSSHDINFGRQKKKYEITDFNAKKTEGVYYAIEWYNAYFHMLCQEHCF